MASVNHRLHSLAEMHRAACDRADSRLAQLLPNGTLVSWTTQRNGVTFRHYGHVVHRDRVERHFCVLVKNDATGKSRRVGVSDLYGFAVEEG